MRDTELPRCFRASSGNVGMTATLEICIVSSRCYAVWKDDYGQIKRVANIPPSIGGGDERHLVLDQRFWNRLVPVDEFLEVLVGLEATIITENVQLFRVDTSKSTI